MKKRLFNLENKKAIVVGGAGDLGKEMVTSLCLSGVQVVVIDRTVDLDRWTSSLSSEILPGKDIFGLTVDLADRNNLVKGFEEAINILGSIDILVNAQGIQRRFPSEDFPIQVWDEVIEINLTSVFEMCQLAGRVMLKKGYGKIINIASMQSFIGGYHIPAYAASKAGVGIITKALSNEWASRGINVNAIAPGYMDTKMTSAIKADQVRYEKLLTRIPAGRWGNPNDLCGALIFLASAASDYVNGVVLPVDGGMLGA